jgi:hypothetical protein
VVEGLFGGRLARHLCCRPLKHCVWIGLDHPNLLAVGLDEYVKACDAGKCEGALTACFDRVGSCRFAELEDRAICADRGEWTDQRTISVEVDAFNEGYRLRNTPDDVEAVRAEYIRAAQRVDAQTLLSAVRPRDAGRAERHCCGDQAAHYCLR